MALATSRYTVSLCFTLHHSPNRQDDSGFNGTAASMGQVAEGMYKNMNCKISEDGSRITGEIRIYVIHKGEGNGQ